MPNSKIISEFLSVNGANVTHSITPASAATVSYRWGPSSTQGNAVAEIQRGIITVQDSGVFDAEGYGALSALTNGMTLRVMDSNGLKYLLTDDHLPIKQNVDWGAYCYDVDLKAWGVGDKFIVARWTFGKSGKPVYLRESKGEYLELEVADTLSGLVEHLFLIQGHYITPPA